MTPFGEKMVELRNARGWTQKKMAEKLGVTPAYLSALENGKRGVPSRRLLHQVCQTFGIIWDEADALAALAARSHPVAKVDTGGLSAEHNRFAHLLADSIADVTPDMVQRWTSEIEALQAFANEED